jgi:hypothetical protein
MPLRNVVMLRKSQSRGFLYRLEEIINSRIEEGSTDHIPAGFSVRVPVKIAQKVAKKRF